MDPFPATEQNRRVDVSDQSPEEIVKDIEQTEDRLAEAVEALAYKKGHVKDDVKEAVAEKKEQVKDRLDEKKDEVVGAVRDKVGEKKHEILSKVAGAKGAVVSKVGDLKDAVAEKLPGGGGTSGEETEGAPGQEHDHGADLPAGVEVIAVDEQGRPRSDDEPSTSTARALHGLAGELRAEGQGDAAELADDQATLIAHRRSEEE